MSKRIDKVNQLIRELLATIIREELSLKDTVLVTILKVDTSRDLRYATSFLSVYPVSETDYVLKTTKKRKRSNSQSATRKVIHETPTKG